MQSGLFGSRGYLVDGKMQSMGRAGWSILPGSLSFQNVGVRVVLLRTGIVLGKGKGALAKMVPPFKLFVGGPLGSGKQWMPWIHLEDEIGLLLFVMENQNASGALNATAPNPVTMEE